ncbi:MAG: hypothetical protein ACT4N8_01210 [Sphingosinicella sp.]|uniref:hypothetical protein n=1 Tax=Sphingosinicella sp. TaxID=1917971 RepID=UPI00403829AA
MTDASRTSPDDIAYVRHLAESGARAPLIGGRFMAWWGFLVTAGWSAQHLAVNGIVGDGNLVFGYIWGSFAILGLGGQAVLVRSMRPKAGAGSAGNLASRPVWAAAALTIVSMVAGVAFLAPRVGYQVFDWIVPVAFAVYACALIVTGRLAGERIVVLAGYGAAAMVGLFTAFILHPDRYLIAAAGAAATVLLPGLMLLAREPKAQG